MNLERLAHILNIECRLNQDLPIIVGVSGGPDSICLLHGLHCLGFPVVAAHFDHGLRPDSQKDAQFVEDLAAQMKIPYVMGNEDIFTAARVQKLSLEEAARMARYEFLFKQARQWRAQAVAVGHTADDQVETVLMHFLRGAGISGLRGMFYRSINLAWDAAIPLVRPLLDVWHEETLSYCSENHFIPRQDETNQDIRYFRNRLRHELLPILENYNPRVKEVLLRSAQVLQGESEIIESILDQSWEQALVSLDPGLVNLSLEKVLSFSLPIQRLILRRAIRHLRSEMRDIGFDVIERGIDLFRYPNRSRHVDLVNGMTLAIQKDHIYVTSGNINSLPVSGPQIPNGSAIDLPVPGSVLLPHDWMLASSLDQSSLSNDNRAGSYDSMEGFFDWQCIGHPLKIRTRHHGDRFKPFGMNGHSIKLSDFFINVHLEPQARDQWPLICSGDEIIWIPGYRTSQNARIKPSTQQILRLQLKRIE